MWYNYCNNSYFKEGKMSSEGIHEKKNNTADMHIEYLNSIKRLASTILCLKINLKPFCKD